MIHKLYILIATILLSGVAFGQSIRDSVFNNVILIKKTDVSTNGFHLLIDIPIKAQKDPIVIFNDDFRIPAKLFFSRSSFLWEQNEIILITLDWRFEKEIREREKREGIHIKAHKNKIYHIKRRGSGYEVDTLSIVLHDPRKPIRINFENPKLKENEVKYFFKECYGSTCCPEDPSWKFKRERNEMKNNFNKRHKVNVYNNAYRHRKGKEGEHCTYYTLSDLTSEQKIEFIFQRTPFKSFNDKDVDIASIIVLPSIINIENMEHLNP